MSTDASSLVAGAKEWAAQYGDYSNGDKGHVYTAPLRARAAWKANDADAFADIFVENGSILVGDRQLTNREEIRSYFAEAFAGGYRGSRLEERPDEIRLLGDSAAFVVTTGGIVRAGAESIEPTDTVRATYVCVKQDGDWRIVSHQTSPVKG